MTTPPPAPSVDTPLETAEMTNQTDANQTAESSQRWRWLFTFVAVLLFLLIFGAGVGTGIAFAQQAGPMQWLNLGRSASGSGTQQICLQEEQVLYPEFQTFWEAMHLLYRDFYGTLPASGDATYGAIRGIVDQLDDPNTSVLTPNEANLFRTNITGSFEGIGARVDWDEDFEALRIVEPFENQPAWNAGLRRGDLVLAVDGESLVGSDLTEAVNKVRGPKGSVVVLTVLRLDEENPEGAEPFDVDVTRDRIETPTISTDTLGENNDIAYVRLNTFNQNAGQLVRQAVEDAVQRDARGLVFDLRGNSGGLLREAVKVASVFLEDKNILIERFADGSEEIYETTDSAVTTDLPMVVLVNEGSASASEIVAGALQDHERAPLIGTITYGKGSVQLPHTLQDGGIMRVTVARWYTPDDRTIDGEGLAPDITVELAPEDRGGDEDPQLDAALDELLNELER